MTGYREVPVHRIIEPLVKELLKGEGTYLIPDLTRGGEDDKRGHYFSNNFSKLLRRKLKITDRDVVFHSLRNCFNTSSINQGNSREDTRRVTGQKNENMNDHYIRSMSLQRLDEITQKVTYGSKVDTAAIEAVKQYIK